MTSHPAEMSWKQSLALAQGKEPPPAPLTTHTEGNDEEYEGGEGFEGKDQDEEEREG